MTLPKVALAEPDPLTELAALLDECGVRVFFHHPICEMWTRTRKCTQNCGNRDMEIKFQLLEGGKLPTKATPGSAGWDLYAAETVTIPPRSTRAVSAGFKVALPSDMEMQIRSRSGLSLKGVTVANSPGTVDSDYRGEVKAILRYEGNGDCFDDGFSVKKGDRIAQAVFCWLPRVSATVVESLDETQRGQGGFGSTGV